MENKIWLILLCRRLLYVKNNEKHLLIVLLWTIKRHKGYKSNISWEKYF